MRLSGFLPFVAALGLAIGGCGKVKDALKDAAGIDELSADEITAMKAAAGWDDAKMAKFKIEKGFKLTDKFPGDLGTEVKVPIPGGLSVPDKAQGAAEGKSVSYSLLKKREFTVGENKFTRFEIVSVARFDTASNELIIDGEKIGAFLDDKERVKKGNDNQEGEYLIVRGEGSGGLAYLTGTVTVKKNDATEKLVGATVYTTESPFVARSGGASGKFLLAVLEQAEGQCKQGGFVAALRPENSSEFAGTPTATQAELPCIGALDEYKGKVSEKATAVGQGEKGDELFGKANKVVTDFLGGWKMGTANLTFVQPPAPPATPPPAPAAASAPPAVDPNTVPPPPVPSTDPTAEDPLPTPTADAPVSRGDEADPQFNLGCADNGMNGTTGLANSLIADYTKFEDYTANKGWRFFGDVRITSDQANLIFGNAQANHDANPRSVDTIDGYCLLSTGNQLYNDSVAADSSAPASYYQPKDGKVSEMWQKVKVPANATGIQIRVAFFSQEYPSFVGTQFNDAFYAMFDESPFFIAEGNLNDLAGINDSAVSAEVAACNTKTSLTSADEHKCGDWSNITFGGIRHGAMWGVASSTEGPALAPKFACGEVGKESEGKCYPGMIAPRVICRELDRDMEVGKTLTLRIGVSDVGDSFYDSALAVDGVTFSTEADPCGTMNAGGATPDLESQVTRNPG